MARHRFMTALAFTSVLCAPLMAHAETDTIKVGIASDMRSTLFGVNRDATTDTILHHVVEGLVAARDDFSVGPALAQSWEISEDGTEYTFTIRDGAVFHNGAAVTSAEVVWSWERLLNPETEFLCRKWFDGAGNTGIKIIDIKAVDEKSVKFTLEKPNALFLTRMAHVVCLSGIVHPDSAAGKTFSPIATGPYTIGEWRKNQYVELEKFADYVPVDAPASGYAGARDAKAEKIRFMVIGDSAAAKSALLAGDIDVLPGLALEAVEEIRSAGLPVEAIATPGLRLLELQTEDPVLQDKRIRQAISHAINLEEVAIFATGGLGAPNSSVVMPKSKYYGSEFATTLGYDPERAKELLAEAGYNGEEIAITTSTRNSQLNNSAIIIQAMLQAVGINAKLDVLEWAGHFDRFSTGKYQALIMGFSARPDPTMMLDVFVGDKSQRANVVVGNPEIVALVAKSGTVSDPKARRDLLVQIHEKLIDDAAAILLFNSITADATGADVVGYTTWSQGKPILWDVTKAD